MVAVRLESVGKSFGSTKVLQGVDAEIDDGAFAVLVGPSGCGKSTLLRLVAGLEEVSTGSIHFGNRDVTHLAPRERDVAMVFQSYALYPHMTVRQNLAFGLELRKTDRKTIEKRVEEVAKTLEIAHLLDRHPRALSGGQRQRVAMGRAIVRRPALFMFDEPLSNLDPALRNQVRVDIRKLHDELQATSLYVTHDQVEAMTLADDLFVLDGGVVQQRGRPIDIYRRPANRFVAGFLGSPAMNFAAGRIVTSDGGLSVVLGAGADRVSIRVPDPESFRTMETDLEVTVGIRPHDVRLVADAAAGDVTIEAELVETLGSHVNVHADLAGSPFIAALEGTRGPTRGDRIALHIEELHLFDAPSGQSLRASDT